WDEDDHIYSGYMSLKTGDFGLNPEHPPLVKMLAALPLLGMDLKVPPLQGREFKHEAFLNGKEFVFGNNADQILFRTRMTASLLTVLLAVLVFLAAQEMFGLAAGFFALTLLVFDPNLLAHGALVTTDVGLSCFLFAAVYAFYRYVKQPSPGRLALVGIATGLAFAAKHTGFLAAPTIALLALAEWLRTRKSDDATVRFTLGRAVTALAVIAVISLGLLWGFYGYRYAARPAGLALNPTAAEYIQGLSRPGEARLLGTIAKYRLLPESYIYGLADVRMISDFYASYLLGKPYPHGVWFYFPVAMLIKSTVPFLVLLLLSVWAIARRKLPWREVWFLAVPPAIYLAVAMSAHMNIGMRHVLPMYAFLTVLEAGAAIALARESRIWLYVVMGLLAMQSVTSVRAYPDYIPYANELWGGPKETWHLLSDSNSDWAQQLKATSKYLQQRGVKDCWFVYFGEGVIPYQYYGIPCKALPTQDALWMNEKFYDVPPEIDGPILISGGDLSGFEYGPAELNPYAQFQKLKPSAVIQNGIYVFDGHFAIPMAAAIGHMQKADELLAAKRLDEALAEAQTAVSLSPASVGANGLLGDVLRAMGRNDEARQSYEKALNLAQTIAPEFQVGSVQGIQRKLAGQ
ncbi:MAG TPA: glycosyltransferase family 39 protein, partial [Candidatus Angelobacter sp.]|nr:glycosyltransferase family 39 protein [Candidatus Angelobacter sp.]